ncbi:3-oxoadipate--succinyl-CoA transferase subunit B [Pseudaminobacter sp. 19-2017]|uniref:3-oxoadipate--succinyl-CoA transferase subunit B n=1 Tax=Pseudaminobacter soli (ex Zhang et al. 2022) TaxID=2831468 RepID=A0A942E0K4_9HYPH|nr:CoA-transferase [Pseudaminobacter soli]MBS3651624.1 3-oxoadipate--succinyl-CoA transferase subunit B [Pseudaminobacter soli]
MSNTRAYTTSELLSVMCGRAMSDGQIVFAGVGVPLLGATLAQNRHAPHLTILFEGGIIGPFIKPGRLPPSTNEMRTAEKANMLLNVTDVLSLLQRGYVDIGFIGGAQIDQYGNVNSSYLGDVRRPTTRLPGSGGGNDISSLVETIVVMPHQTKRFVENVDFITSPGYVSGGKSRAESGLIAGGVLKVITDLCIFGFHPETRRLSVQSLHPGVSLDDVLANMSFRPEVASSIETSEPPLPEELEFLRYLDPERMYLR